MFLFFFQLQFIAIFALVAAASAQHYQNDYYHQQPQYNQYQAPAVIKSVQPALIKSVQPAIVKSYQPAIVKEIQPAYVKKVEYAEAPANYEFNYDVHDPHTGDIKQQHEVAKEGSISGQYSLIDADGYRRIVDYTADDHHGFQANVRREPVEGHKIIKTVQPAIAVQKVIAQPAIAVQKYVAPAPQYSAPQYSAPQYSAPQYSAPQYYSAPAPVKVAVAQPVVQKYVAPVVQKYVAPAPQYYQAPAPVKIAVAQPVVQKYVAAPVAKVASHDSNAYTHVSFNGPSSNYHY
jgi:hypothetical protein